MQASRYADGNTRPLPIIVGGCHRSGTSLVRRILDAHSRIYCGPEVKFWRDFYGDYFFDPLARERFSNSAHAILPEAELFQVLGGAFVALQERAAARAGKARWADKNPENVIYLPAWQNLLGDNWVFLHIVRNPWDTLASIKEAKFDDTIPLSLEARRAYYERYVRAGLEFGARCPARYRRLIYEELTTEPEPVLRALMEWLGEALEPVQLRFNEVEHQHGLEDPKIKATTKIHAESIGRWKTLLTRAEAEQIRETCAGLWSQIDPAGTWLPTAAEVAQATGQSAPEIPAGVPSSAELAQLSAALAQEKFEMEQRRAATERWTQELLEQIAIRDRELGRIKNLMPVRLVLAVRRAVYKPKP